MTTTPGRIRRRFTGRGQFTVLLLPLVNSVVLLAGLAAVLATTDDGPRPSPPVCRAEPAAAGCPSAIDVLAPVPAIPYSVRAQVAGPEAARWLREHPGGILTGHGEITYPVPLFHRDAAKLLTVTVVQPPGPRVPDCPAGRLCLYTGDGYRYPRLTIRNCGFTDPRDIAWDHTRSIHNAIPRTKPPAGVVGFHRAGRAGYHNVFRVDTDRRTAERDVPLFDQLYIVC